MHWTKLKLRTVVYQNTLRKLKGKSHWKEIFIKQISNTRLDSRKYTDHLQAQSTRNPVEKWAKYLNRPFTKDINVPKYMKSCSTSTTHQRIIN